MVKIQFLTSLWLISQVAFGAYDMAPLVAPEVEKSTGTAALTMDQWVAKQKAEHSAPPTTAPTPAESAHETSAPPAEKPHPKTRVSMNEMAGTIAAIDVGEKNLRITVEGGYHPQFNYDEKTVVTYNDQALTMKSLKTGDKVRVRYIGRDLTAREVELQSPPQQNN